ncbi:nuclear transport factor 2 family protein [Aquibium sp. ELW1220]|uniref:nuclear transport factor 2 family protein n=1 Tax=Aquibium sp. ELW1220 TaxID=2976766 RepID=UPI0025B10C6B|nr:nuclear transport factor 2 family protein [Aquibium sp. ELW1220]MDN2578580.1 nuclear transport factor 2 family protein [Aquibium sp. ELW1220]
MSDVSDTLRVIQLIQAWGFHRDQGSWADLADTFTVDGSIAVTWFCGRHGDFIERCRATHKERSPRGKHLIGVPVVRLAGDKAVAETNVQILGRVSLDGIAVDNTSHARFLDRLVRTGSGWRIARRDAIYEKDRLDPVVPSEAFDRFMRETDFSAVPEPYRYLGYRLLQTGRSLVAGILEDGSPEALAMLEDARSWLAQAG